MDIEIPIKFQPKQKLLYDTMEESSAKWFGFGGSRGGGKSFCVRPIMIARRLKYAGTTGVIFRKTYKDLQENHINPFFDEYPQLRRFYNVTDKALTLPNKSRVLFLYQENDQDLIERFQGKNYDDVFVDEATHIPEKMLVFMATSCRSTHPTLKEKFLLTMNPGGKSHVFIKRIFIDKKYNENESKDNYKFIQSYGWDNIEWVRRSLVEDGINTKEFYTWDENKRFDYFVERSGYGKSLNSLPDSDRKAHLFGDWYVFAGQFFSMWDEKNIIDDHVEYNPAFSVVGGLDYGERTVLEIAQQDYEGNITFIAECYTTNKTPGERANACADMLIEKKLFDIPIVYDTNMDISLSHYVASEKRPIDIFREVFEQRMGENAPRLSVVSKHSTEKYGYRVATNETMKDLIHKKKLKFSSIGCPHAVETIPELMYGNDKNGMDFNDKVGEDDPYDACITGDSLIHTTNGDIPIQDLIGKEGYCYGYLFDKKRIGVTKFHHARSKGIKDVWKVTFDDGTSLQSTADHKFLKRDGNFEECQNLSIGDSLMPLYQTITSSGHIHIRTQDRHGKMPAHRMSYTDINGDIKKKYEIHHIDENKSNNNPSNLIQVSKSEHLSIHSKRRWNGEVFTHGKRTIVKANKDQLLARAREHMMTIRELAKKWHNSKDGIYWHIEHAKKIAKRIFSVKSKTAVCSVCNKEYSVFPSKINQSKFCSPSCNQKAQRGRISNFITKICKKCGNEFSVYKHTKKNFCSKSCAHVGYFNHKIKSIEYVGAKEVFDITTDCENFAVNGVIVHNCKYAVMKIRRSTEVVVRNYSSFEEYADEEIFKPIHERNSKKGKVF